MHGTSPFAPPPPPSPPLPLLPPPPPPSSSSMSESEINSSSPCISRTRPKRTVPRCRPDTRSWEKTSRCEPSPDVGDSAADAGSEPRLVAGERVGDAASSVADAVGFAIIAALVGEK
ncbi:hypothetical protein NHX12_017826 [Muraenolepis orangiensis]|uniref:Uncharacterized protein n=1 Tax=Muraenolepis orangiensis TaxID=630683 RepID=A0A9Q0F079_9TELE|nr:hypothetical protein NHX12_017826 [Muraenolepis orangiensis]